MTKKKTQDAYPFPGEKTQAMKIAGSNLAYVVIAPRGLREKYPAPKTAQDAASVTLDWKDAVKGDDGVTRFENVVIAKEMVQDYDGVKVLKPAEELRKAAPFASHRPVVSPHPDMGIVTDQAQVCGFVENPAFKDAQLLADLSITCEDLCKEIEEGKKREVSIGFHADWVEEEGKLGEDAYTMVQRNLFIDHVAVVEKGRCSLSDGCGIKDTGEGCDPEEEAEEKRKKEEEKKETLEVDALVEKVIGAIADRLKGVEDSVKEALDAISEVAAQHNERLAVDRGLKEGRAAINEAYEKAFEG